MSKYQFSTTFFLHKSKQPRPMIKHLCQQFPFRAVFANISVKTELFAKIVKPVNHVHIMESGKNKISWHCPIHKYAVYSVQTVQLYVSPISTYRRFVSAPKYHQISGYYTAPARFPITWIKITHQILSNNILTCVFDRGQKSETALQSKKFFF